MLKIKKFCVENIRELGLIAVIILISIFVNVRSGGVFLTFGNISDLMTETAVLAILSIGMMLVLITRGIDLSIGAVMALAGMVGATVMKNNITLHPIIIILVAVLIGTFCGMINGFLVSRLKILPIIATLGMMNVFRGTTYLVSKGGWVLQRDMSAEFMAIATGSVLGINNLVMIALLLYIAAFYFMNYVRRGRQIYAVGNSPESAMVSGINNKKVLMLVYTVMGALSGLAGILYICKYAAAQGETATGYEMNVIAACVLGGVSVAGGVGKIQGVLLGALLFGTLNNALPLIQVSAFYQQAIRGLIIIISVIINAVIQRKFAKKALERRSDA